jgi:predicted RNA-binding Zn ribbon-like protein
MNPPSRPGHRAWPAPAHGAWPERVGGHAALDLVNTVAWRADAQRTIDRLGDADALVGWTEATGLVDTSRADSLREELATDPALGEDVLQQCRSLRETTYRLLQPLATGSAPGDVELQAAKDAIVTALSRADVDAVMPLRWEAEVRTLLDLPTVLALAVWRLLQFEDVSRLRQCRDTSCGWLFLDMSKNASRVWCSSADCGNRERARTHYQRRQEHRAHPTAPAVDRPRDRS